MAHLLRFLILLMFASVVTTILVAKGTITSLPYSHIEIAIPTFIYVIFAQAFVMFYFIGCSRLVTNVYQVVLSGTNLDELFENPPEDLGPYKEKTKKMYEQAQRSKRQTIPWTMLMLILGMIGFLFGGAHDTNLVPKVVHSGVIYGFFAAMIIGFFRQWYYLGKVHVLLRKIKALYAIPDAQM